jgi:SAM-dependent methyltransferase
MLAKDMPVARREQPLPEYDSLANFYDLEYAHDYDLPFWLSLAEREAGPVIEWGAGTGRMAVRLAAAGHDVTAVEISAEMVERGRTKGQVEDWVVGDMRHVNPERRYGLAVCGFNSFLCLRSIDDALAFLRNAREHLVPGGLLGIEVSAFSPDELGGGPELRHDLTRDIPNGRLDRFSVSAYDPATQLMQMRLFYERYDSSGTIETRTAHDLTIRIAGRAELELMLRLAGFEVEAVYGGFEGEPFTSTSDHLVLLARG